MRHIRFLDFELDLDLFELRRDEEKVPLSPRALDVLRYLIEHRTQVVSKEQLRQEIWNGATLSAAAIPTTVLEIRKAIGDDSKTEPIIASKRGRGYHFLPDVKLSQRLVQDTTHRTELLPFVGRNADLDLLLGLAKTVRERGAGRVALVSGEAGIGKTRLLNEFSQKLKAPFRIVVARCSLLEGAPPFWPWIQALKAALQLGHYPEIEAIARPLADVHPELVGVLPADPAAALNRTGPTQPTDRFTLFNRWIETFQALARNQPLLLAFEDIHLADGDTLALLACLAEEIEDHPILLLATHRPPALEDQRVERIAEIGSTPDAFVTRLAPLDLQHIERLLGSLPSGDRGLGKMLCDVSGGVPFYLTHLLRIIQKQMPSEGQTPDPLTLTSALPLNGREIVARQLSDLPHSTRRTLAVAALIGDRFSGELLTGLLEQNARSVFDDLQPALRAWLVVERSGEYEFSHALLRQALAATLEANRKRELHLRLADELRRYPDAHTRTAQIAEQLVLALPLGEPKRAIDTLRLAAAQAIDRFAYAIADQQLERALEITRHRKDDALETRCQLLQALAACRVYTATKEEADPLLLEAAEIARKIGSPRDLAQCALQYAPDFLSIEVGRYDPAHIALVEEALDQAGLEDKATRAKLMGALSQALQWARTPEKAERIATEALELAEQSGDPSALLAALAARAESLHGAANADARLPFIERLRELALASGDQKAALLSYTRSLTVHLERGDIPAFEAENERYRNSAIQTGLHQYLWYPGAYDTTLALMRGRLNDAETLAREYRALGGDNPDPNSVQVSLGHAVMLAWERDQTRSILPTFETFEKIQPWHSPWPSALMWTQVQCRELSKAGQTLGKIEASDIPHIEREPGGTAIAGFLLETSIHCEQSRLIRPLYESLRATAESGGTGGYGVLYLGSLARYAGLGAFALGEVDDAIALLERACEHEKNRGAPSWQINAEVDLSRVQRHAGASQHECRERLLPLRSLLEDFDLPRAHRKLEEALTLLDAGPAVDLTPEIAER